MGAWLLTDEEDDALQGLPLLAQTIYVRVLRRHMDYGTGIVGRARRVSYQQMRETCEVDGDYTESHARWQPSVQQINRALRHLEGAGLIVRLPKRKRTDPLVFRLPHASQGSICPQDPRQAPDKAPPTKKNPGVARDFSTPPTGARHRTPDIHLEDPVEEERSRSGAGAPSIPNPWDIGARILGSRGLLGRLIRDHGDEAVRGAIWATVTKQPAEPKAYLIAAIQRGPSKRRTLSAVEIVEAANPAGVVRR